VTSRLAAALPIALVVASCLTVTHDRPAFEELDPKEQAIVDIVLTELKAFNAQVKTRTKYNIDEVIDRQRIDVAFEGMIFTANIGDNVIHIATWENLTDAQRVIVQGWFKSATPAAAKLIYETFFYRFMAVVHGVKQYMYKVLTTAWLFDHRTLFNIEKDSVRTALSHYAAVGRKTEIWGLLATACAPIKAQHDATYSAKFTKQYLADHIVELADPANPTGYMYFYCRWIDLGKAEAEGLTIELNWLRDLPL
jgi:hypothetical protein